MVLTLKWERPIGPTNGERQKAILGKGKTGEASKHEDRLRKKGQKDWEGPGEDFVLTE